LAAPSDEVGRTFFLFIIYFTVLLASPYWQDKDKQKDLSVPGAGVSVLSAMCSAYL
jgi:hypothetical protein